MDISAVQQLQTSHNLSQVFHTSGLYVRNRYQNASPNIQLVDFKQLAKDQQKKDSIWSNYEKITYDIVNKEPIIRPLIEDLMTYERAIWDATFCDFDLKSYRRIRENNFKAAQEAITANGKQLWKQKFKMNTDEPYTLFKTKWNWYADHGVLPTPRTPVGTFNYLIRPTLFKGTVLIKNLLGIHAVLPILARDFPEFDGEDILTLIKDGATPDYAIPSDNDQLQEDIISFLREHLIIYNSMCAVIAQANPVKVEKRKSFVL